MNRQGAKDTKKIIYQNLAFLAPWRFNIIYNKLREFKPQKLN